ncbi:MAG TPA: MmgE/PrpD family protein [Frankiaceae bacterium]
MTAHRLLVSSAAGTDWARAPQPVRRRVVDLVADVVAVAGLASTRPELLALAATVGRDVPVGPATVVGSERGWPAATAAFLNGCAVAADQLQDGHRPARGHPAAHVVVAALAYAESWDASDTEFLSAVLAGYEVGTRIGRMMGGTPPGVHDIGTWGQVAASAALARLLAPGDIDVMSRALDLSAAAVLLTDARTVFAGRTGSHLFLGSSVQQGVSAALAAVAGLVPEPGAVRRHLAAVAAAQWSELEVGCDPSGWTRYEVLDGYVKVHPTCAHLHGVNDAIDELLADGIDADAVTEVEVRVFAGAAQFAEVAQNELAARFSVPTSVAIALATGRLDESTVTDEVVTSARVRALADRVRVVHDPQLDAGYPAGRPARVSVTLTDGSVRTRATGRPRWDADRAPDPAELAAKSERLLRHRFGGGAAAILEAVHRLGDGGSVRQLGRLLRAGAGSATGGVATQ